MCFTLPTPEDPFNEGIKKKEPKAKKKKKLKAKKLMSDMNSENAEDKQEVKASPKTVVECLNAIQEAFVKDGTFSGNKAKPVMVNTWGMKFWKSCSEGSDVLETSGGSSTVEQIAWIVSTAAAMFTKKVKGDANPFLLFLVPSKEKAIKVVDGLESFAEDGSFEKIKSIREAVTGVPQTVILNNSSDRITSSTQRKLLRKQFCTLSLYDSVTSQNA
ncbi:hypothetical protein C5167_045146 [Papaver somniferum]|uniref:Uncharacterized protein n=1 Tax=Papaver somniferum TaxID=3469 RepID=A0A4Y7LDT5_PAPSO|nr:hypothetical protein C5167_045146 [Papaver somniferum]